MNLRSRSKVWEVNMSSMTDLVFLLLIFFILCINASYLECFGYHPPIKAARKR